MLTERPTCTTCAYWDKPNDLYSKGRCCLDNETFLKGVYTDPGQFCGSHNDFPAYLASVTLPKVQADAVGEGGTISVNKAWFERLGEAMEAVALSYRSGAYNVREMGYAINVWDELPADDLPNVAEMASTHDRELNGATDRIKKVMDANWDRSIEEWKAACVRLNDRLIGSDFKAANYKAAAEGFEAQVATLKANAVEQAEIIAMKDETIKLKNEAIAKLREDKSLRDEMLQKQGEEINRRAKGMEGLRRVIASKNRQAEGLISEASKLRGEVARLEELNDRQERGLDEAKGRYQELAEAAQSVAERWTGTYDPANGQGWVERVQRLVNVVARHASSADEAMQVTPTNSLSDEIVQLAREVVDTGSTYPVKDGWTGWVAVTKDRLVKLEQRLEGP